jgi:hypothetical protein
MLRFLGWSAPDEDSFASDVRNVLVSEGFSKEVDPVGLARRPQVLEAPGPHLVARLQDDPLQR